MQITKELIQQRLKELTAQEEKALADLNAISGARQQCHEFLELLSKEEES